MSKRGIVLFGILTAVAMLFVMSRFRMPGETASDQAFMRKMAGPAQSRAWRTVLRRREVYNSFKLVPGDSWTVPPQALPVTVRVSLQGRFNASPADEVTFDVLDPANAERFQQGSPPLALYSVRAGQPVNFVVPSATGYTFMFVQHPKVADNGKFPTSVSELALLVLRKGIVRPPADVTAEIDRVFECFCTLEEQQSARKRAGGR